MEENVLLGLVAFTIGLAAIVFPRPIVDRVGKAMDRNTSYRWVVLLRAIGFGLAVFGFVILL